MPLFQAVLFILVAAPVFGQPVPAKWNGTWVLNVQKSTFAAIPGAPSGMALTGQTLKIEQTRREIRLSGDTVVSVGGETRSNHDDNSLSVDGTVTVIGAISLSFKKIDDLNFEIISKLNVPGRNTGEVSRYSASRDGSTLTATKTQTEQQAAPEGGDRNAAQGIRTSTSVLVYQKVGSQ